MSQATIRIPAPLRSLTGGASEITVEGDTIAAALGDLGQKHEGLTERLLDPSGELRAFVNLYLDDTNVRALGGLRSPVPHGATIHLVPAVAGGGR